MTIATQLKPYTEQEYLDLEIESDIRHEYCNGAIIPLTGGTPEHNAIARMLVFLLTAALRKQPYRFSSLTNGYGFQTQIYTPILMWW